MYGFNPLQPSGMVSDLGYARFYEEYDFIFLGTQINVHEGDKSYGLGCPHPNLIPFIKLKDRIHLRRNLHVTMARVTYLLDN